MKFAAAVVLVLSLAASGLAFTNLVRAGTNAARGAMNTGTNLMNNDFGGRQSQQQANLPANSPPSPLAKEPLPGGRQSQQQANLPANSPPTPPVQEPLPGPRSSTPAPSSAGNPLQGALQSLGSPQPILNALTSVKKAVFSGNSPLTSLTSAVSLHNIMTAIMNNPLVIYIINAVNKAIGSFVNPERGRGDL